ELSLREPPQVRLPQRHLPLRVAAPVRDGEAIAERELDEPTLATDLDDLRERSIGGFGLPFAELLGRERIELAQPLVDRRGRGRRLGLRRRLEHDLLLGCRRAIDLSW